MRDGGTRTRVSSRHLAALFVLAAMTIAGVCPRGALATLRLVTLGALPQTASAAPPEMAEPITELSFAVVPAVVRRRLLGPPAPPPPDSGVDGAGPLAATVALAALLAASAPRLCRLLPVTGASPPTAWGRAPPLRHLSG
jgi:hypothetical protein